jgi:hypothetical protein
MLSQTDKKRVLKDRTLVLYSEAYGSVGLLLFDRRLSKRNVRENPDGD